ncbi:MAG TPA: hypothetical protein VGD56_21215, partial [Gemmatirosa sp.]
PAALALLFAAACGRHADRRANAQQEAIDSLAREAAQLATGDSSPASRARVDDRVGLPQVAGAAGDSLRIVSTDGTIVYTLVRDTVRMQLGDSLIRHVRQEVNTGTDSAEGSFAGFIKSTVAGAVGSAMRFVIRTPVRDIKSARYEDGELRIESRGSGLHGGTFSVGGKQHSDHDAEHTAFARADAERFIAAIDARRRALGVQ